ncbi:MAG: hypothetical protein AB7E85_08365 [Pseudobdellovibrionaceae bacterium]
MDIEPDIKDSILNRIQEEGMNANDRGRAEALIEKLSAEYDIPEEVIEHLIAEHQAGHSDMNDNMPS